MCASAWVRRLARDVALKAAMVIIDVLPPVPPTDAPPVPPTDAPPVPPTDAPAVPPTDAQAVPPTDAPPVPPTDAPPVPPTDAPTVPPTDAPPVPPTDAPPVPPTDAPPVPPTDAPPVPPTDAPPVPPTDAPPVPPTDTPPVPPTDAPPVPPTDAPPVPATTPPKPSTAPTSCSVTRAYCHGIRIVDGTAAAANEYPYQVIIVPTIAGETYQCGGSIIKKRWILTAAHCFFDKNENQAAQSAILVGYGSSNRREVTLVTATRYILHENYNPRLNDFDIALIELPSDLNYESDATIQPICLAEASDIVDGGKAVATGWGALKFNGTTPDDLQEVVLDIISTTQCLSQTGLPRDTSSVLCALTAYKDTCQGDSGGPLVVRICPNRWAQIGIVSYGEGCANPEKPGVYTRVPSYRTWIDTNTGSSTTC
ncbi:chymotrypsin-2-like [Palaemon carinicauda]|uniref:chymotrypsin-2-like n=1 Tax=Palaemon carinicauda TaxID=392227 RepID=UPI0035B5C43D